jgi:ATP-dependent helicase/nuclease subunit A
LFRRRTRMPAYEQAFAAEGLRVCNASDHLFDSPAVKIVLAVCQWLAAPTDPSRLDALVSDSPGSLDCLSAVVDPTADQPFDVDKSTLTPEQRAVLEGLEQLRSRRDACLVRPAAVYVEDIIDTLALRPDSHDFVPETDPAQRVANLDALVDLVKQWEGDQHLDPAQLVQVAAPFLDTPRDGPSQPATGRGAHDVVFRTIHDMKGDESDVVALADLGFDLWVQGQHNQRLLTRRQGAGLAPPVTAPDVDLPVSALEGNLYTPDTGYERDVGLRWATERWANDTCGNGDRDQLLGPPRLAQTAGQARAESWRLLFVALTRACEHLVVPLPRRLPDASPRDRWLDTIRDGLQYEGQRSTYSLAAGDCWPGANAVSIAVDAPDPLATRSTEKELPVPDVAQTPRRPRQPWVPRTVAPSTLYPLTEHPDEHVLAHLLEEPLHTETRAVSGDLPFDFDRVGPETVGSCLHSVVARLVTQDVPAAAIRAMDDPVVQIIREAVTDHAPAASEATQAAIRRFFVQRVCDPLLQSELWAMAQEATEVAVEQPVAGEIQYNGFAVTVRGTADLVFQLPSGARHVVDVKIALAEPTPAIRRRYEVQLGAYISVLAGQSTAQVPIEGTLETFGVTRSTLVATDSGDAVTSRLETLLGQQSV